MSTRAAIGQYKGNPTISLAADAKYPFSFGAAKAALIVEHFDAIKAFSEANKPRLERERQESKRFSGEEEKGSRYQSNHFRFAGGGESYQNKNGRCEDAPCCGCCS